MCTCKEKFELWIKTQFPDAPQDMVEKMWATWEEAWYEGREQGITDIYRQGSL